MGAMTPGDVIASLRVALEQHEARIAELEAERDEAVGLLRMLHDLDNGWKESSVVDAFLARIGSRP